MNSCSQAKQAAQECFQENQRLIREICDGLGVTPMQLLEILRTVPDNVIEQPVGQVFARLTKVSAKHGSQALSPKWDFIATLCQHAQVRPSALAAVTEGAIALELVEDRTNNRYTLYDAQPTPLAAQSTTKIESSSFAQHWEDLREWLVFPRACGVSVAALLAAITLQPIVAVLCGLVLWGLLTVLAIPLWRLGHKDGGEDSVWAEAKWFWKLFRPVRTIVAYWPFRWVWVATCMMVVWVRGVQLDFWWGVLGLFFLDDLIRTVTAANRRGSPGVANNGGL